MKDKQKMITALGKLAEAGGKLLESDVTTGYQVWKTEVLTVSRKVFDMGTPEYKDLENGFWRYEEFIPAGSFEPKTDLRMAVSNVVSILRGQVNALGYDVFDS